MLSYFTTMLLVINLVGGTCLEIEMAADVCQAAAQHIHIVGILMPGEISTVENLSPLPVASAECRVIHEVQIGTPS
jgi:hypothetical protein